MKTTLKDTLRALLLLTISSCANDDTELINEGNTNIDVYVSGTVGNSAVYWKNGVEHVLSTENAKAHAIFVTKSNDVYVAGLENHIACYWKNDTKVLLTADNEGWAAANDIYVTANGNVHTVGWKHNGYQNVAIHWTNTDEYVLTDNSKPAEALALEVDGDSNVYIVGMLDDKGIYWSNDNFNVFEVKPDHVEEEHSGLATDIVTRDQVLYISGIYKSKETGNRQPYYRQGAQEYYSIADENADAAVLAMFVPSVGNVYTAGNEVNSMGIYAARYWKLKKKVSLSEKPSNANGIWVNNDDVYVVGGEVGDNGSYYVATIWVNGKRTFLSPEVNTTSLPADATDIFIKNKSS